MRKSLIFTWLLLATVSLFYSQELPEIIPPSPNAASLGKYGQVPVGLFTGTPQISIPIYTLEDKGLTVPVSLNYSSNGIRVDEIASHVGFGWSLNAGGVITRAVYDQPDEVGRISYDPANNDDFLLQVTTPGRTGDIKPDIFSFNFNGYSGKFFLDDTYSPVLIDPSPVTIIKLTNLSESDMEIAEFKITGPDGVSYYFGGINATETSFSRPHGCGSGAGAPLSYPAETAWYLTAIEDPAGHTITLSYETDFYTYESGISQSVSRTYYAEGNDASCANLSTAINPPCLTKNYTSVSYIKEITSVTGKIIFDYVTDNTAFATEQKRLQSIKIRDINNNIVKEYELDYSLFNSDQAYENPDIYNDDSYGKRLFLTAVTEKSAAGNANSPYSFEYYDPGQLPPRFSYAQDYWGYFNGKGTNTNALPGDLSMYNSGLYQGGALKEQLIELFSDIQGDKTADGTFGIKGMLKKITYPTGGSNELFYEPHSYYGQQQVFPPKQNEALSVETGEEDMGTFTDVKIINNPFQQDIYINGSVVFNSYDNFCDPAIYPTHWITATLTIEDLSSGENIHFWDKSFSGNPIDLGASLLFDGPIPSNEIFVTLEAGKSYQFELKAIKPCLFTSIYFEYYDQNYQTIDTNIAVGGNRISQITTNDMNGESQIKKYYYGTLDCLDCSSGVFDNFKPAVSYYYNQKDSYIVGQPIQHCFSKTATLSSSSLMPLYTSQGYHIVYGSVIEGTGEDFEAGGILHTYETILDQFPIILEGDPMPGTPYTNVFGKGNEVETIVFKKVNNDFIYVNKTQHHYTLDNRIFEEFWGYDASVRFLMQTGSTTVNEYNFSKYAVKSYWSYLDNTIEEQYDENGQNPTEIITTYYYDNPEHLQVSRKKVTTTDNKAIITRTFYPDDIMNTTVLGEALTVAEKAAIDRLKKADLHNIGTPVQIDIYKDNNEDGITDADELISTQRTNYKEWYNNVVLPEYIQTSKEGAPLENRIVYADYDEFGHPLEVSKDNGTRISYIWGYQQSKPIAKLEGIAYADIDPADIANLQALSDNDIDGPSEQALRNALNLLYEDYPGANITTFTYDPLVGVTSITDPKGYTYFYSYDNFNRLESVEDQDGNLIEASHYNYGQQNQPQQ